MLQWKYYTSDQKYNLLIFTILLILTIWVNFIAYERTRLTLKDMHIFQGKLREVYQDTIIYGKSNLNRYTLFLENTKNNILQMTEHEFSRLSDTLSINDSLKVYAYTKDIQTYQGYTSYQIYQIIRLKDTKVILRFSHGDTIRSFRMGTIFMILLIILIPVLIIKYNKEAVKKSKKNKS